MRRGQSRRMSACEIAVNYFIGFAVALMVQCTLMQLFGIGQNIGRDTIITLIFTCVSIARSYCVRRLFNWIEHRKATT